MFSYAGVRKKTSPAFGSSRKRASRPFSVVLSLPFVLVVSPPVITGAHDWA